MKELNYHSPRLAEKLKGQSLEDAVRIWRDEMVKGGIQQATQASQKFHREKDMADRLSKDPNDSGATEYFNKQERQRKVDEQYQQMKEEYPEALGRVLMLYVDAKINGYPIQAFCDSGAQSTIMSKRIAEQCGLSDYIDTRFEGTAVGVGTGKILGRIHMVQLEIGGYHFPCSVTVMDDPQKGANEMPFLFGLDMMKRHTCQIDLERGVLKFRLSPGEYMETPFLHEKDLDETKGGTQGFNAEKANQELMELELKREAKDDMEGDKDMDASSGSGVQ
jgi:DNA damage-inducible protein 1